MTREEKRAIRLQICRLLDEERRNPFVNNSQKIEALRKKLENNKIEFTSTVGIKTGKWTQEEIFYLMNHAGKVDFQRIADKLCRTKAAVTSKYHEMKKRHLAG
ncbi:hypothetical protein WD019_15405 [Fictibacillus sp. Mic-4]|uniref:hypothetical protein n=1 Tax=Fictibacillus sp. Mic-4 TaxID=3132826 RepID=UPI003CF55C53